MIVQSTDSPVAHGRRARGDTDTPTGRTVATARANRHYATATSARRARGQHQQPAHPRHARVGRLDDHRARTGGGTVARGEGDSAAGGSGGGGIRSGTSDDDDFAARATVGGVWWGVVGEGRKGIKRGRKGVKRCVRMCKDV